MIRATITDALSSRDKCLICFFQHTWIISRRINLFYTHIASQVNYLEAAGLLPYYAGHLLRSLKRKPIYIIKKFPGVIQLLIFSRVISVKAVTE
jgi:hypothetical protein